MIELSVEELMVRESIREFLKKELEPIDEEFEKNGQPSKGLVRKMGELGFLGTFFPEEYGGGGLSLLTRAIISEETSRVNAGLDITLFAHLLVARNILLHGDEKQKMKYIKPIIMGEKIGAMGITEPDAGSDALSIKSTAVKEGDHYRMNGSKTFITNAPIADYFIILARTSTEKSKIKGGTWFILERGMEGLSTGPPLEKLGMKSSPTGEIFMDDVVASKDQILGKEGEGFSYMMESLDVERVLEGGCASGISQACLEASVAYVKRRYAFGKPIAEFQLIQEKIASMAIATELIRNYLYQLCRLADKGEKITKQAAILKLYSTTVAVQTAQDAIQVMGGYGYMEENKVARYFRDAKHHEIGGGTSEIMKLVIARETLKGR